VLVRPDDVGALAAGIRSWLDDPGLRDGARAAARERRQALPAWADTAAAVVRSLEGR
jgi:glycosyltransferase involved in cell wall biosynthesis